MSTNDCHNHREVTARKPHRCCECRGEIGKGERHAVNSGIYDEEPYRFRTCFKCEEFRAFLNEGAYNDDERVPFGAMAEFIVDSGRHTDPNCSSFTEWFFPRLKASREKA